MLKTLDITGFFGLSFLQTLHRGEQQHIADGGGIRHQHTHTVDAVADAARGRHAVLQRHEEVFVGRVGLFVALGEGGLLRLEALALVDRVVQLGIGVRHLPAVHEQLETLNIVGILGLFLCQR